MAAHVFSGGGLVMFGFKFSASGSLPVILSSLLCSRISQESNRKEPLLLALVLGQALIHVKGHVPILDLAIVLVYSNKYYPTLLESKQNCLPTCRTYITDEIIDNCTTETDYYKQTDLQIWV